MKNKGKIIAIDFDGTIVRHLFPATGGLKRYAKEVINRLHVHNEIIIWTCRTDIKHKWEAIEFLSVMQIKFDSVNHNSTRLDFKTDPKIYYDVLIDDRNLGGLPGWLKIERMLIKYHGVKV